MNMHDTFGDFNNSNAGDSRHEERYSRPDGVTGGSVRLVALSEREMARLRFHQWRLKADCEAQVAPHSADHSV